jgi:hypothetical protein
MNRLTASVAVLSGLLLAGPAFAQTGTSPSTAPKGAVKMSQSDCDAAWKRLDTASTGSVAQAQATASVSDFKSADANSDGKLSQAEFRQACDKGLVRSATGPATSPSSDTGPMKK